MTHRAFVTIRAIFAARWTKRYRSASRRLNFKPRDKAVYSLCTAKCNDITFSRVHKFAAAIYLLTRWWRNTVAREWTWNLSSIVNCPLIRQRLVWSCQRRSVKKRSMPTIFGDTTYDRPAGQRPKMTTMSEHSEKKTGESLSLTRNRFKNKMINFLVWTKSFFFEEILDEIAQLKTSHRDCFAVY